tara:strand:- start:93869 stop:94471 length:603 start_codon:yes stop_codon:yes gene_type:complete
MISPSRCPWATSDPLYLDYHDSEWGAPQHDDQKLFEMLILEGAQAGLSWLTVLKKREAYRLAFENFDARKVAQYDTKAITALSLNKNIIRNRLKLESTVKNAQIFLSTQEKYTSFDNYIWQFVNGVPLQNFWQNPSDVPAQTDISIVMSKDMKQRGFSFVGPTICYAYMQATGMVNDHLVDCFRYKQLSKPEHYDCNSPL